MKILYTSDIHVDPDHLERLLAAIGHSHTDAVIIGGDLIPAREWTFASAIKTQRQWILRILLPRLALFNQQFPGISFFFDFGNDDLAANRPLFKEKDGNHFNLIHGKVVEINPDLAMAGYMMVRPTPFTLKDWEKMDCPDQPGLDNDTRLSGAKTETGVERRYQLKLSDGTMEEDLAQLTDTLEKTPWQDRPFLFVSHCPPADTSLDILSDGRHAGSLAIRRFIEHWGPSGRLRASFHGHIHESPWMSGQVFDRIEGVPCFNAGQKPGQLRALLFDSTNMETSIELLRVRDDGRTYKMISSGLKI